MEFSADAGWLLRHFFNHRFLILAPLRRVRRHMIWDIWEPELTEALAHPVGDFMRRYFDVASAGSQ